jgi:transglutaminase-like putative cysteine protease
VQIDKRKLNVECSLSYDVLVPTTFIFNIAPAVTDRQKVSRENLSLPPGISSDWFETGAEGYRSLRLHANTGQLKVNYRATVELCPEAAEPPQLNENDYEVLPPHVLRYLNPSRYCESDRLARFSGKAFGNLHKGYSRVESICEWVNSHIDYVSGATNVSSSACDVLLQRAGVCRDFAHVCIALCRSLGIPSRYVSGYAPGLDPPDFHGFFESFLGDQWYLFDATHMAAVHSFVRIGVGRDAADVPFANIVGQSILRQKRVAANEDTPEAADTLNENVALSTA